MKQNHDAEDCPCQMCFKHEIMGRVLEYCDENEIGVFDVVGILESVQHDLLEIMNAKDAARMAKEDEGGHGEN